MSYVNLNNPANFQLQEFEQLGFRYIVTGRPTISGETYRTIFVLTDAVVTATCPNGDSLSSETLVAGTVIHGFFEDVSVASGSLLAYKAGPITAQEIFDAYKAYVYAQGGIVEGESCAVADIAALLEDKLYSAASLVLIPSGYKVSHLYAERPLDSNGDFTFTRASSATRVNSSGLVEKVRTNLALYSEDFTNAAWAKISSATVTGDTTTAPNGTTTADTITAGGGSSTSRVRQSFAFVAGAEYAISIYVKANDSLEGRFATLNSGGTTRTSVTFTHTAGVVAILGSSGGGTTDIESVGSGWYRISHQIVINDQSTLDFFADRNGTNLSWYTWGAMIETGVLTPYIGPTLGTGVSVGPVANLPRLDYLGSTCPRLLLEPQRTNLLTYSEQLDNAAYTKVGGAVVANNATSPDGYTNADTFTADGANSSHRLFQTFSATSGSTYTASFFVKKGTADFVQIAVSSGTAFGLTNFANFDILTGVVGTSGGSQTNNTITDYGNGWYRISSTITAIGTATAQVDLVIVQAANSVRIQSWTSSASVILYGAALEVGAYATSYIPTLGSTVTRLADVCSKTGISSLIGQTEGTLYAEVNISQLLGATSRGIIRTGTATDFFGIVFTGTASNTLRALVRQSAVTKYEALFPYATTGTLKVAIGYKSADSVFYVNGTQVASIANLSFTLPTIEDLEIGSSLQDSFSQALLFKTRLTNAQLAELTTL